MADKIDISAIARVVDQASGPLKAIANTIKGVGETAKSAGSALARMATQGAFGGVAANVKNVGSALGRVGSSARALFGPLAKIGAVIGLGGIAGTIASMREYIGEITNLGKVSRRTGASTDMIQGLTLMTGSAENAENMLTLLTRGIAKLATAKKPDPRIVEVFRKMGLNLADIRSGAVDTDTVINKLVASFYKQTNQTSKLAVAQAIAGKGAKAFLDVAARGPEQLAAYIQEAVKRNKIDDEQIEQARAAARAQADLAVSIRGVKNSIMAALLPAITPLITEFDAWILKSRETWLSNENIRGVIDTVVGALRGLWEGINETVRQLGGWQNVMLLLGAYMGRNFIGSVFNLGIAVAKLGASAISLDPLSLAIAGIGGAAYLAYQNWDKIGPAVEAKFQQVSVAAKQAWAGIKQWAATSWQEILRGFQTGGIWGAITAAGYAAARGIISNWNAIVGWFQSNFPQAAAAISSTWETIKSTASSAWTAITGYALKTINDIAAGWRTGGLEGAATATWNAIKGAATGTANFIGEQLQAIPWASIGSAAAAAFNTAWKAVLDIHTWLGERLNEINWPGIATNAGNLFVAAWKATIDFAQWLQTLDWSLAGEAVGRAIGNALAVGLKAAWAAIEWAATIDPGQLVWEIVKGLWKITDAAVQIAGSFVEGLISGIIKALLSATGLDRVVNAIIEGFRARFPKLANIILGPQGAAATAALPAREIAPIAQQVAEQVVAAPQPAAAPPAPLAPTTAPPELLAQARETAVQLQGEIAQRLRVDMSPDLRAMLEENRTRINQLGVQVRSAVDVGLSMAPAAGAIP